MWILLVVRFQIDKCEKKEKNETTNHKIQQTL
jgi:hypothetical protein